MKTATPVTPEAEPPCARYWGSDGTLCSTHNGRFLSDTTTRCDRAALEVRAASPDRPDAAEECGDDSWDTRYACVKPKGHPVVGPGLTDHDYQPKATRTAVRAALRASPDRLAGGLDVDVIERLISDHNMLHDGRCDCGDHDEWPIVQTFNRHVAECVAAAYDRLSGLTEKPK